MHYLSLNKPNILKRIEKNVGEGKIENLIFKIG